MPDPHDTAAAVEAAAGLLLREPDGRVADLVAAWSGGPAPSLPAMRQDFHDVLCIPQSGRYVPAFEHVVRRARREGRLWIFPPARYDGGRIVEGYYARLGFTPAALEVAPVFRAPHLPGDHLGFMLAFAAFLLRARERARDSGDVDRWLGMFVRRHLDRWPETYAALLEDRGGPYLEAVASGVREAVALLRECAGRVRAAA